MAILRAQLTSAAMAKGSLRSSPTLLHSQGCSTLPEPEQNEKWFFFFFLQHQDAEEGERAGKGQEQGKAKEG